MDFVSIFGSIVVTNTQMLYTNIITGENEVGGGRGIGILETVFQFFYKSKTVL